jgi:hypothetical protein
MENTIITEPILESAFGLEIEQILELLKEYPKLFVARCYQDFGRPATKELLRYLSSEYLN